LTVAQTKQHGHSSFIDPSVSIIKQIGGQSDFDDWEALNDFLDATARINPVEARCNDRPEFAS
jgi:hypothetical protein